MFSTFVTVGQHSTVILWLLFLLNIFLLKQVRAFSSKMAAASPGQLAKYLQTTDAGFAEAAALIRSGKLVAFPTETVYGLGANAYDE
ncbi:unnamed protein product, partial [Heterosigma akashiwo]